MVLTVTVKSDPAGTVMVPVTGHAAVLKLGGVL